MAGRRQPTSPVKAVYRNVSLPFLGLYEWARINQCQRPLMGRQAIPFDKPDPDQSTYSRTSE
jgi:hypothetical protein